MQLRNIKTQYAIWLIVITFTLASCSDVYSQQPSKVDLNENMNSFSKCRQAVWVSDDGSIVPDSLNFEFGAVYSCLHSENGPVEVLVKDRSVSSLKFDGKIRIARAYAFSCQDYIALSYGYADENMLDTPGHFFENYIFETSTERKVNSESSVDVLYNSCEELRTYIKSQNLK